MSPHQHPGLLLCTGPGIGGTERAVLGLARGLRSLSIPMRTVFPYIEGETGAQFLAEEMGVSIEILPEVRSFLVSRKPHDLLPLRRLVQSSGAQVVNIHYGNNRISIWDSIAIRLSGVKHRVASVHHPVPFSTSRARILTVLASRLYSCIVVTTPVMTKILTDAGVSARRIQVVPLGLQPPAALPDQAWARAQLGIPPDALVVGSLGRLVDSKGFDDLIRAMALVERIGPPIHLLIGGEGPLLDELKVMARRMLGDRARVLGRVADADMFYAALDVFALASHAEGFGMVFIEAAFHGVPSVGTRVGGVAYAIKHGQTGLLVPDRDPPALAATLTQLLLNPELRRSLGAAARAQAHREFSERAMAERYRDLLFGPIRVSLSSVPEG